MTKLPRLYDLVRFSPSAAHDTNRIFYSQFIHSYLWNIHEELNCIFTVFGSVRELRMWSSLFYRKFFIIGVIIPPCTWNSKISTGWMGYNQIPTTIKEMFSTSNISPLKWNSGWLPLHSWRSQLKALWPNLLKAKQTAWLSSHATNTFIPLEDYLH